MIRPRDQIDALVCGYPRRLRERCGLLMLLGYGDDSGNDPQQCAFVIAGLIADPESWKAFSDDWEQTCRRLNLDPFKFKTAAAERLRDGYWGPPAEDEQILAARRDEAMSQLAAVVKKYAKYRFHAVLDWNLYRELASQIITKETNSPYFFLFWNLLLCLAAHTRDEGFPEKVDFVFDTQGRIGINAALWYSYVQDSLDAKTRESLGAVPTFRCDNQVLPLKGADMLAWSMLRHLFDKTRDPSIPMRPTLQSLLEIPIAVNASLHRDDLTRLIVQSNAWVDEDHP